MHHPEIAIVDSNTLNCLGLKSLLKDILPMATIRIFHTFGELTDDTPDMYAHYFISAQIYFEHTAFFLPRKPKTIVLVAGDNRPQLSGIPKLNIHQDEQSLVRDIRQLRQYGHPSMQQPSRPDAACELSAREVEVLKLITQGFINKEIADRLNISLTTVISHRKNLTEKLGIKSVSGLTVYAVMNGLIEADSI